MNGARIEAELKFRAEDERPLRELAAATVLGSAELGPARVVAEIDRYLDSADLRLSALRWACRLRTREGRTVVSLKGPAEHAAGDPLHRRPEIEGPASPVLEPISWPPSAARDRLLAMSGGEPLLERFRLEQERTERAVMVDASRVGLLSLDRARLLRGGFEIGRLAVVELELEPGAELDHLPLADALAAVPGLVADPLSKFEHALALLAG